MRATQSTRCWRTSEVAVKHTGVFGCSTKWQEKQASRLSALAKIEAQPVKVDLVSAADLKTLRDKSHRQDAAGQLLGHLVRLLHTRISPIFEETYRMYSVRDLELVTVSANMPDEKNGVMKFLEKMHATSRNLLVCFG